MRSELGKITLDKTFEERESLNANIVRSINDASQAWGITCLRYEIRDITPPVSVKAAMDMQAEAERRKRASILESEGEREAAINSAEGSRQSIVLKAQGEAQAIVARANAAGACVCGCARNRLAQQRLMRLSHCSGGHPTARSGCASAWRAGGRLSACGRAVRAGV